MTVDLSTRAMMVDISISVFSGEKLDKAITQQIADTHQVEARQSGNYKKQIISKHSLEPIKKVAGAARQKFAQLTLPWSDVGGRLLSTTGYFDFCEQMRTLKSEFLSQTEIFISAYPDLIEEARKRLNGMFDINDYPDISGLKHRFVFETLASPLPNSSNWVLDLAAEEVEQLKAQCDTRMGDNIDAAIKDTYRRIAEVTSKMVERLNTYDKVNPDTGKPQGIFRDSLVSNVTELVDILPSLNITDSPELAAIADEMKASLCKFDAPALRADPLFRKNTVAAASAILAKVQGLF